MTTTKEKWQEIANRGLQDKFDPETRAKFDEAVRRGLIKMPSAQESENPKPDSTGLGDKALGVAENVLSIGSSALAEPAAGLAGIYSQLTGGNPTKAIQETRESLTFVPKTEAGIKQQEAISKALEPVGQAMQETEKFLGDSVFELTGSPSLAAAASSLPTAALEALGFKGSKAITTPSAAKIPTKRQVAKAITESAPEIKQIKEAARSVYNEIDNSGVAIKPESYQNLVKKITKETKRKGLDARVTPKAAGALEVLQESLDSPMNFGELDTLRKVSQNVAKNIDPTESALGNVIISEIDDYLDNLSSRDIVRGSESSASTGKKFKSARKLWGRARRSELIQEAIEKGVKRASGAENGIRIELDKITRNKKLSKYFPKAELRAIDDVVAGDFSQNMAKLIGRFGFSEGRATNVLSALSGVGAGGLAAGGIGAFAVPTIGTASRSLAQKLTKNRARFLDSMTRAGNDAKRITTAYLRAVPKSKRSAADLSSLLSDPSIDLNLLEDIANKTVQEAVEIAKGRRVIDLSAAAGAGAIPSILEEEE